MKTETLPISISEISPKFLELFRQAGRVLILSHQNPDGDAIGSAVGLASAIENRGGPRADLYLAGDWSDHLAFLLDGFSIKPDLTGLDAYDLVVLLDCHSLTRLGPYGPLVKAGLAALSSPPPVVVIDHHLLDNDDPIEGEKVHQPTASSTGELVWRVLKTLGWNIPRPGLQGLLLALVSDTGFFSQSNTTAGALQAAADLVACGGDLEVINRRLKQGLPLRRLKIMGLALGSLKLYLDGQVAVMLVTPEMLQTAGAMMTDTEDFVEFGRSLEGVTLSVLIKDPGLGRGQIKVSLRSRDQVDASVLAKYFNGGGHRQASAYNDEKAVNAREAADNFMAVVERFL